MEKCRNKDVLLPQMSPIRPTLDFSNLPLSKQQVQTYWLCVLLVHVVCSVLVDDLVAGLVTGCIALSVAVVCVSGVAGISET